MARAFLRGQECRAWRRAKQSPVDPAPVQGQGGEEVEKPQDQVHQGQVVGEEAQGPHLLAKKPEKEGQGEAHRGPRQGDGELLSRLFGNPFQLGHPAQEPEGDAPGLHPIAPGGEGVAQLVEEDGEEEA
jgi:hypothetical protein